jgi:ketosteroid isomerase-like protein
MTKDDLQAWLDRYVEAWRTYDESAIRDLFAENAEYRYHPWDEPVVGRDAIVKSWIENRDEPGTWTAEYEAYAVDGDRGVAIGESAYYSDASQSNELRRYWNNWLIRFDADGRCVEFVEYYMQRKK